MIQHVKVDHHTHDAVMQAAKAEGMTYNAKLALIVEDWARTYRGREQGRRD